MTDQNLQSLTETTTPTPDALVYVVDNPSTSPSDRKLKISNLLKGSGGRELLLANRIYYVRKDGSNSNTGLADTAGGAFLTIQYAINQVAGALNLGGYDVTIKVGAGTYAETVSVNSPWDGNGTVTIEGNSGSPSTVIIDGVSSTPAPYRANGIIVTNSGRLTVLSLTVIGGMEATNHGTLTFNLCRFGAADAQLAAVDYGVINPGNYWIDASASTHLNLSNGTYNAPFSPISITLAGTPAFTYFLLATDNSLYNVYGMTWLGTGATGTRYYIDSNSVVNFPVTISWPSGETYFPGNAKGIIDRTSVYGPVPTLTQVASDFSVTSSTTLVNVTGLTFTVKAGGKYRFSAELFTTSNAASGVKAAISGTATMTSIVYDGHSMNNSSITSTRATALSTAVGAITAVTTAHITIKGIMTVNAEGTVTVQFAQNVSGGTASIVLAGSYFEIEELT